jgi:acetyl esterase
LKFRGPLLIALALMTASPGSASAAHPPDDTRVFLTLPDGGELFVDLFHPAAWTPEDRRPAIVLFFGGGWNSGEPARLAAHARRLTESGLVAITPQYRTRDSHGTTPRDALADARAALRWVRRHARELGIDPARIAAGGGSAGGHLAAASLVVEGFDHPHDDRASPVTAAALVLFNPVLDNGPAGYGFDRVEADFPAISPFHQVRAGLPPTLLLLGDSDHLVPVGTLRTYARSLRAHGTTAVLHVYPGQGHGFYFARGNPGPFDLTLQAAVTFFRDLGWLPAASFTLRVGQPAEAGASSAGPLADLPQLLARHPEATHLEIVPAPEDLPHLGSALIRALDRFPPERIAVHHRAAALLPAAALPAFHLVGDSISLDYHDALAIECAGHFHYTRKGQAELARRDLDHPQGANGGDSSRVLEYLRGALATGAITSDTVVVNCGLHDIKIHPATGERQIPLDAYRAHLAALVALVHDAGKRLVWISTTPVDDARHQSLAGGFHRHDADRAAYHAAALEIMTAHQVPVIDLHAFTRTLDPDLFRDHVHFLPAVSRRQAAFIRSSLDAIFGDLPLPPPAPAR